MKIVTRIPPPPPRPHDAHKGTFGTVIVVGGSMDEAVMLGAPALSASAALRSGAGLVKVASTKDVLPWVLMLEPCATGLAMRNRLPEFSSSPRPVLAVGPGLGRSSRAASWVRQAWRSELPLVLDADGLNLLAQLRLAKRQAATVLTPHPGEHARLSKAYALRAKDRPEMAADLAQRCGAVVLLKGHRSVVSDGRRVYVNHTGGPLLATAGSGDVLTGIIAGLMAQGMDAFDATVLGAFAHGKAAQAWGRRSGDRGFAASDLLGMLWRTPQPRRGQPA